MVNDYFASLTINGETYSKKELHELIRFTLNNKTIPDWKHQLFRFIDELLNKKNYITARSSGTTGKQKNIRLPKNALIASALRTQKYFNYQPGDNALLSLPVQFIAGKMMVVRAFVSQLNLMTTEPVANPFQHLDTDIHFAALTPYQLSASLNHIASTNNVQKLIVGGGTIPTDLQEKLQSLKTRIFETYGMTETCTHIALKPVNGVDAKNYFEVLDDITISTDGRNCLVINVPELDSKIITNDVIERTNDGFRWLGRADHIVNSGGIKIIPEQLEQKLNRFISQQFMLCGVPDESLGEKLVLLIEGKKPDNFQWIKLKEKLSSTIERYEIPKEVYFITNFARTKNGKVKRNSTRDLILGDEGITS